MERQEWSDADASRLRAGHTEIVDLLLRANAPLDVPGFRWWTALSWAAAYGVVKALLEAGTDVDCVDMDGWAALNWAAENGHYDVVDELLKKGATAAAEDKDGKTALYWAHERGHCDIAKLLQSSIFGKTTSVGSRRWDKLSLRMIFK